MQCSPACSRSCAARSSPLPPRGPVSARCSTTRLDVGQAGVPVLRACRCLLTAQRPIGRLLDSGDTALLLVSAGLVLLMTPGLAFFYGGLVRGKNVVHTMILSLICMALVGVLWGLV